MNTTLEHVARAIAWLDAPDWYQADEGNSEGDAIEAWWEEHSQDWQELQHRKAIAAIRALAEREPSEAQKLAGIHASPSWLVPALNGMAVSLDTVQATEIHRAMLAELVKECERA